MPKDLLKKAVSRGSDQLRAVAQNQARTHPYRRSTRSHAAALGIHTQQHISPGPSVHLPPDSPVDGDLGDKVKALDNTNELIHPEYSDPTADLDVVASDGMHFRVHSAVLKLASKTFAQKLKDSHGTPIPEDRSTLRALFDSVYPRHLSPKLEPFTFVTNVATAADRYDLKRVTVRIREALVADPPLQSGTPLHHYILASTLHWNNEARHVSRLVPPINPTNPEQRSILKALNSSDGLLDLMSLHQTRRDKLLKAMSISYDQHAAPDVRVQHLRWESIASGHPSPCRSQSHNMAQWDAFKLQVLMKLDRESSFDFADKLNNLWELHYFKGILEETCSRCKKPFFERDSLILEFRRIVERLPDNVDI